MAQIPKNEKLYAMVVTQAKAKYRIYPSPGASHWVHRRYLELGGTFEDSTQVAYKEKLMKRAVEAARKKKLAHGEDKEKADKARPKNSKEKKSKKDKK
jgi:hypothetical protein